MKKRFSFVIFTCYLYKGKNHRKRYTLPVPEIGQGARRARAKEARDLFSYNSDLHIHVLLYRMASMNFFTYMLSFYFLNFLLQRFIERSSKSEKADKIKCSVYVTSFCSHTLSLACTIAKKKIG